MQTPSPAPATLTDSERLETLGLLAAGLAHEVASPLQAIIHNLRYLQDGLPGLDPVCRQAAAPAPLDESYPLEELQSALADSVDAAQRASAMVRTIAEFAQGGTSEDTIDLPPLVASVTTLTRNAWKYIAEVDTVLPPGLPPVRANQRSLSVALARGVLEAARALAGRGGGLAVESSRLLIEASRRGDRVEIVVSAAGHRRVLDVAAAEA